MLTGPQGHRQVQHLATVYLKGKWCRAVQCSDRWSGRHGLTEGAAHASFNSGCYKLQAVATCAGAAQAAAEVHSWRRVYWLTGWGLRCSRRSVLLVRGTQHWQQRAQLAAALQPFQRHGASSQSAVHTA